MKKKVLEFHHISKEYPGVNALTDVSFDLYEGEVLALMGENGAGKSTLIKCITGANTPTSGEITVFGKSFHRLSPTEAREMGIGAVYQEFMLVPDLPIVENIFMGNLPGNGFLVDKKTMRKEAKAIFDDFGIAVNPDEKVRSLSPAMMQIVEIAKAVSLKTRILVLDEPTAPLTIKEVDTLFSIIRKLKKSGVSIIYISHRMEEIFEITDRVVVLRDGKYICQMQTDMTSRAELIQAMIGREMDDIHYPHTSCAKDEVVLEAEGVTGNGVTDISFQLHKGEILGFAGLVGAGRTELMSVLFGDVKKTSGTVKINNSEKHIHKPYEAIKNGVALLPEDRKNKGLLLDKTVLVNITLSSLSKYCRFGKINHQKEKIAFRSISNA